MKNKTAYIGKLRILKRLKSSKFGNPRFLVELDGQVCRTMIDSPLASFIHNLDGRICRGVIGTHYGVNSIESCTIACVRDEITWRTKNKEW